MKKILCLLLCLIMLTASFASCTSNDSTDTGASADTTDTAKTEETTDTVTVSEDDGEYTVKEDYVPQALRRKLELMLLTDPEAFEAYTTDNAPYALQDMDTLTDVKVNSISLPIHSTKAADGNGDFTLTLYVIDRSPNGLKAAPLRTYKLKVNAEEHKLTENSSALKFIDIDLSKHKITLTKKQSLALFSDGDTLIPARFGLGEVNKVITDDFPAMSGYFCKVGTAGLNSSAGSLICDFELERTYESRSAYLDKLALESQYNKLVKELKEKYEGKHVSILGDSISTFAGYSNDKTANSTIAGNAVYYTDDRSRLPVMDCTWWATLIRDTGMKLCVNNSWSGSMTYAADNGSGVKRATELDRDDGTKPDVIIFFMGTNDLLQINKVSFGSMAEKLKNGAATQSDVDTWWKALKAKTNDATSITAGTDYTTFEEAYALALYRMTVAYPDAEIFCLNIGLNRSANYQESRHLMTNATIAALAEYFDATLIDQYNTLGYTYDRLMYYAWDVTGSSLHPNAAGHALLASAIIKGMASKDT